VRLQRHGSCARKVFCKVVAYAAGATASDGDVFLRWSHDDGRDQQFGLHKVKSIIKSVLDN